jgi:hypothetical protein
MGGASAKITRLVWISNAPFIPAGFFGGKCFAKCSRFATLSLVLSGAAW